MMKPTGFITPPQQLCCGRLEHRDELGGGGQRRGHLRWEHQLLDLQQGIIERVLPTVKDHMYTLLVAYYINNSGSGLILC